MKTYVGTSLKGLTMKRKREKYVSESETSGNEPVQRKKKTVTVIYTPVELLRKGEKMYMCSACDLTSDEVGGLYQHMDNEHKEFTVQKKEKIAGSLWDKMDFMHGNTPILDKIKGAAEVDKEDRLHKSPLDVGADCNDDAGCGTGPFTEKNVNEGPNSNGVSGTSDFGGDSEILHSSVNDLLKNKHTGHKHQEVNSNQQETDSTALSAEDRVVKVIKNAWGKTINGESAYKCSLCGKASQYPSALYNHMKLVHKGFLIQKLRSDVHNVSNGQSHNQSMDIVQIIKTPPGLISNGEMPYRCSRCGQRSNDTGSLYDHMKTIHKDCLISKQLDLGNSKHIRPKEVSILKSSPEDIAKGLKLYKCSECCTDSEHTFELYKHMEAAHPDFVVKESAEGHPTRLESREKRDKGNSSSSDKTVKAICVKTRVGIRYKCSECGLICLDRCLLHRHARKVHKDFKIVKIRLKKNSPANGVSPKGNMKMKAVELNCGSGDPRNSDESGKTVEVIEIPGIVRAPKYKCSECSYTGHCTSNIYKHLTDHHPGLTIVKKTDGVREKDGKIGRVVDIRGKRTHPFKCSECNRTSDCRSVLYKHMKLMHKGFRVIRKTDKKASVCSEDGNNIEKQFVSRRPYKKGGRYKCSECDYTGNKTGNLYNHMAKVHKGFAIVKKTLKPKSSTDVHGIDHNKCSTEAFNGSSDSPDAKLHVVSRNLEMNTVRIVDNPIIGGSGCYKCSQCDVTSNKTVVLYTHMRRVHKDFEIIKRVVATDVRINDSGEHDRTKIVYIIDVPQAGAKRVSELELKDTVYAIDVPTKIYYLYKCSACDRTSLSTDVLYRHMQRRHMYLKINKEIQICQNMENYSQNGKNIKGTTLMNGDDNNVEGTSSLVECGNSEKRIRAADVLNEVDIHSANENGDAEIIDKLDNHENEARTSSVVELENGGIGEKGKSVHIVAIRKVRNFHFKCSECDKTSYYKSHLYYHMRKKHQSLRIVNESELKWMRQMLPGYKDSSCDAGDDNVNNDGQSSKTVQIVKNPVIRTQMYKCSECDQTNYDTGPLYAHMQLEHKGFTIVNRNYMNKKDRDLSSDKGYDSTNKLADNNTKTVSVVEIPVEEEHQFKCSECDKTSNSFAILYVHMENHHKGFRIIKVTDDKLLSRSESAEKRICITMEDQMSNGGEEDDSGEENDFGERRFKKEVYVINIPKVGNHLYKCSECDKTGQSTSSLYHHMAIHHKGFRIKMKRYNIQESSGIFDDGENYFDRDKGDSSEETDSVQQGAVKVVQIIDIPKVGNHQYKCSECDTTSHCTSNLYKHMRFHHKGFTIKMKTGKTQDYFDRGDGDKSEETDSVEKVVQVIDIPKVGNHQYKCSECDTTSHGTSNLYHHMKLHHKGFTIKMKTDKTREPFIQAEKIQEVFVGDKIEEIGFDKESNERVVQIIDIPKVGKHQYKCSECDKTSHSTSNLYKHMKLHHKGFRIKMKTDKTQELSGISDVEDNYSFRDGDDKSEEVDSVQEGIEKVVQIINIPKVGNHQYKCSECDQTSHSPSKLYYHMQIYHADFKINQNMDKIRESSELFDVVDENDFEAGESNKSGETDSVQEEIDKVVQIIDIPKVGRHQYKCSECDKTGKCTSNLYKHMKLHHKGFRIKMKTDKIQEPSGMSYVDEIYIDRDEGNKSEETDSVQDRIEKVVKIIDIPKVGRHQYKCSECDKTSHCTSNLYKHMHIYHKGFKIKMKTGKTQNELSGMSDCDENYSDIDVGDKSEEYVREGIGRVVQIIDIPMVGKHRYKCSECDKTSFFTSHLYNHMKIYHKGCRIKMKTDKTQKSTGMPNAEEIYCDRDEVERTVQMIDISKQGCPLYKCSQCSMTSRSTSNLYRHMSAKHKSLKILNSNHMSDTDRTENKEMLGSNVHKTNTMNDENEMDASLDSGGECIDYACDVDCDDVVDFAQSSDIQSTASQSQISSYECCEYMATFASRDELDNHVAVHISENCGGEENVDVPGKAEGLDIEPEYEDIVYVVDLKTPRKHHLKCSGCDETSDSLARLYQHMESKHKGLEIKKEFDCDTPLYAKTDTVKPVVQAIEAPVPITHWFKCSKCNTTSDCTRTLYRHMKVCHKGHRIVKICDIDISDDFENNDGKSRVNEIVDEPCTSSTSNVDEYQMKDDTGVSTNDGCTCTRIWQSKTSDDGNSITPGDRTVYVIDLPPNSVGFPFKCSECGQAGHCMSNLYRHMRSKHKALRLVKKSDMKKSPVCDRTRRVDSIGPNRKLDKRECSDGQNTRSVIKYDLEKCSVDADIEGHINETGIDTVPFYGKSVQNKTQRDGRNADDENKRESITKTDDCSQIGLYMYVSDGDADSD